MVAHANVSHLRNISVHQNKRKKNHKELSLVDIPVSYTKCLSKKTGSFVYWYFADLCFMGTCVLLTDSQFAREKIQADTVNKIS